MRTKTMRPRKDSLGKRILCGAMSVVLTLGLMPGLAFAGDDGGGGAQGAPSGTLQTGAIDATSPAMQTGETSAPAGFASAAPSSVASTPAETTIQATGMQLAPQAEDDIVTGVKFWNGDPIAYDAETREYTFAYTEGSTGTGLATVTFKEGASVVMSYKSSSGADQERTCASGAQVNMGSYIVASGNMTFTLTATLGDETQVYKCTIKRTPRVGTVTVSKPGGTALSFTSGETYVPVGVDKVVVNARSYVAEGVNMYVNGAAVQSGEDNELSCDYDANGVFTIVVKAERDGLSSENTYKVIVDEDTPSDALGGGKCGTDLKWYVSPAGALVIHGAGAMNNYSNGNAPWMGLRESIKNIKINDGVTTIGNYAFSAGSWGTNHLTGVKRIVIPNSVTAIGDGAFLAMPNLSSVSIGSGVQTIGGQAFSRSGIKSIVIPENVKTIGTSQWNGSAFASCPNLASVEIYASDLTMQGSNHFQGCANLAEVYIGSGVKSLGSNAFSGCSSLADVTYEAAIDVPDYAFQNCSSLKSIHLPAGVTAIGRYAFSGCAALMDMDMGSTVASIGNYAFRDCSSLKSIEIPGSVNSLGTYAFQNCSGATVLNIGSGVTSIPNYAFDGCSSIASVTVPAQVTSIGQYAFRNADAITEIVIPASVKTLGDYAFRNCDELASATIESADIELNAYQFMECPKLTSIKTAGELKADDAGIIYSADGKTLILCPAAIEGEVAIPEGVEAIGDAAFAGCAGITKVTMPNTLVKVGANAFQGCAALESADLPVSVTEAGEGIFSECGALKALPALGGLTEIPSSAFEECTALTSVNLPDTVTSIGNHAFYYCDNLASVTLPSVLTALGQNAFRGCSALETIDIPGTVSTIPNYAFDNCTSLTDVTLHEGLTSIGHQAFSNTAIERIEIPEGVTSLGNYSLGYNRVCPKEVVLPVSLKVINQNYTFGSNNDLRFIAANVEHFYYRGTDDQFQEMLAASGNSYASVRAVNCPVTYLYGSTGAAPAIADVSDTLSFAQGADATGALKLTVEAIPEGATLSVNWYKSNSDGSFTKIDSAVDGLSATATPSTAAVGAESYYAVATLTAADGSQGCVVSDNVRVLCGIEFPSGDGTVERPFEIATSKDFETLKLYVDSGANTAGVHFRMSEDVALPDGWAGLGTFHGVFDGDNHVLTIPEGGKPLFSVLANATVQNLSIYGANINGNGLASDLQGQNKIDGITVKEGSSIRGSGLVSTTAGSANRAAISNCTVEKNVKVGWDATAGAPAEQESLAGYYSGSIGVGSIAGSLNGSIVNCVSYADVYGYNVVGGIMGRQAQSMSANRVVNCEFHGNVHATGISAGGIVGAGYISVSAPNGSCVTIQNCLVTGNVEGSDYVGGIFGGEGNATAGVEEAWSNGVGYVTDNLFAGKVYAGEGAVAVGAIVGYMRGINAYNVIENNYYAEDCGAARGIGKAFHVDTSAVPYGIAADGTFYFNSAVDDLYEIYLIVDGPEDAYRSVTGVSGGVRDDNPLANTAVTAPVSAASLADGTTAAALNGGVYSLGNWTVADSATAHQVGAFITNLELSGDYKTEYVVGEAIDTSNMLITATYSDGSVETVDPANCTFELDTATAGTKTVTVSYKSARVTFTALVAEGTSDYNPDIQGTVYISVSDDGRFKVSDGNNAGAVLSYVPVDLAEVAKINLDELGLGDYKLVASGEGADYRYDVNVLQLFAYVQAHYGADGAEGLQVSGAPGSLLVETFMGHDMNFNYYVNGAFPMQADKPGIGATCDEVALTDGDFVDVSMFTDYDFIDDPLVGFHYFLDDQGAVAHAYTAVDGEAVNVALGRIYENTGGIIAEADYPLRWGSQADWESYYGVGSATRPDANAGTAVITDESGKASISFPEAGAYYVWADGALGTVESTAGSYVSSPAVASIEIVTKGASDAQAAQAALDVAGEAAKAAADANAAAAEALKAAQDETDAEARMEKVAAAQEAVEAAQAAAQVAVEAATAAAEAVAKAAESAVGEDEQAVAQKLAEDARAAQAAAEQELAAAAGHQDAVQQEAADAMAATEVGQAIEQAKKAIAEATAAQADADAAIAAAEAETDPVAKAEKATAAQTAAILAQIAADKANEMAAAAEAAAAKALEDATTASGKSAAELLAASAKEVKDAAAQAQSAASTAKASADGAAQAAAAAAKTDISGAAVSAAGGSYSGKKLEPAVTVKLAGKELAAGTDYDVSYTNNTNAGAGVVIVKGKGAYTGSAVGTFTIAPAKNAFKATAKAKSAKKAVKVKAGKAFAAKKYVKAGKRAFGGKLAFELAKAPKKIRASLTVNPKNGKITVAKGTKKGTYTIKVKLTSKATANYTSVSKTVKVKLKVK
ncbi:MAG TPA: hypothetical protein DCP91_10730 [Eggerthellaceae bacterium]|nr:hypothetical protein [Eggerthellaceae bacterium]